MIKGYHGFFKKANGDVREMFFVRTGDLPEQFLSLQVKGTGKPRTLKEGLETVWDVQHASFRIFNWGSTVGDVEEVKFSQKDDFSLDILSGNVYTGQQ